ncbi:LacI family DNA-binding transcriptional regulator [Novisyntrophococcus fermenticellae]|uniref:LacI family DNA-binding transcriptional regulator n=1 Tax=Novisyntrophococcus fermenticellae TaxID=2068655 RepID=UPI001E3B129E|nr:LacI family DNA-binding transcriptional regulator [Novisyntrophococcus fermenticellae]
MWNLSEYLSYWENYIEKRNNDLKITMKDIANVHGVSVNAVSLALNNKPGISDEMRIRILRTAEEMGYLETREKFVRTFARTNICVMMQKRYSQDMDFYGKVLYAVVEEAKKNGYDTLMNFFDDGQFEIPKTIAEYRVAGVIVIGKIGDCNIQQISQYSIPIVLADHASLTKNIDSVITDNKLGSYVLARYLIEKGFQKIGFYGELGYSLSIKERFWGYREALFDFMGSALGDRLDLYIQEYSILDGMEEAILSNNNNKIVSLVKEHKSLPEVFVCSNDKAAISLMMALQTLKIEVPGEISLVGFDNITMSEKIRPRLTTVNVNKELMGKRAVQRLIYKISHKKCQTESTVISVELIERDSVLKKT